MKNASWEDLFIWTKVYIYTVLCVYIYCVCIYIGIMSRWNDKYLNDEKCTGWYLQTSSRCVEFFNSLPACDWSTWCGKSIVQINQLGGSRYYGVIQTCTFATFRIFHFFSFIFFDKNYKYNNLINSISWNIFIYFILIPVMCIYE